MRKISSTILFILTLLSCVNAEENSADAVEFERKNVIGTWERAGNSIDENTLSKNPIRFQLKEDSTAQFFYRPSEEGKIGKWTIGPKMEIGNDFMGMSFEADLMITFQKSPTEIQSVTFDVREKDGNLVLKGTGEKGIYYKQE